MEIRPFFTLEGKNKSALAWVQQGAEDEDSWDGVRFTNHFYNPLNAQGLNDVVSGNPSFMWATWPGGNGYTWQSARSHQYDALTETSRDARDVQMAKMLRDLGHVIHLIQDLSQPGHVRNDNHAVTKHIEKYGLNTLASLPFPRGSLAWRGSGFTKLEDFWDRGLYSGASPQPLNADAAARAGLGVATARLGLAEFTNGNLLSEDALYREAVKDKAKHGFPYPLLYGSTNVLQFLAGLPATARVTLLPDQIIGKRLYLSKVTDGIPVENHAVLSYTAMKSLQKLGQLKVGISIHDDNVLAEYHSIMLPNAIQYSAGCLDYFFRGSLGVLVWRKPGESIFRLAVSNGTQGPLVGGTFELFWDDAAGNRTRIGGWDNTLLPVWDAQNVATHIYSMTTFDKPPGLTAKNFIVVYKGTINANATAPADPVDQDIAIAAVRFDPPIHCYEPVSVAFSGVAPGPRTTSFPINASFSLTEVMPEYVDPNEPPTGLSWYVFQSGEFEVTYEFEDQDGVTQTGSSQRRIGVWPNPGDHWRAYAQDGFANFIYPGWTPPPVELPGNGLRLENLRTSTEGIIAPSASGGHAVIMFR